MSPALSALTVHNTDSFAAFLLSQDWSSFLAAGSLAAFFLVTRWYCLFMQNLCR